MDQAAQRPDKWWMLLSWVILIGAFGGAAYLLWRDSQATRERFHGISQEMQRQVIEANNKTADAVNKLHEVAQICQDLAKRK
jgi:cytoskeletal protein RodZ